MIPVRPAFRTYIGGYLAFGWGSDDLAVRAVSLTTLRERIEAIALETFYYTPELASFVLPKYDDERLAGSLKEEAGNVIPVRAFRTYIRGHLALGWGSDDPAVRAVTLTIRERSRLRFGDVLLYPRTSLFRSS